MLAYSFPHHCMFYLGKWILSVQLHHAVEVRFANALEFNWNRTGSGFIGRRNYGLKQIILAARTTKNYFYKTLSTYTSREPRTSQHNSACHTIGRRDTCLNLEMRKSICTKLKKVILSVFLLPLWFFSSRCVIFTNCSSLASFSPHLFLKEWEGVTHL